MTTFYAAASGSRQPTPCDACGKTDERGKHHVQTGTGFDPATGDAVMIIESKHFSCCINAGCPDGSCPEALAAEEARMAAS